MIRNYIPATNSGKRFVVGDIHGCLTTFETLLWEKLRFSEQDQLFLLGDYVNCGPDSEGVLNLIIYLIEEGYQIYPIRGNHEVMYLEDQKEKISPKHRTFLQRLPFYYHTEDFFFVHAGFNFTRDNPLEDTATMIWGLGFEVEPNYHFLNGRRVIHGHDSQTLSSIFDDYMDKSTIMCLDNGCHEGVGTNLVAKGNLCALELNDWKLFVQHNMELVGEES